MEFLQFVYALDSGKISKPELQDDIDINGSVQEENKQEEATEEETNEETTEGQEETTGCHCGCPYCCGGELDANKKAGVVSKKKTTTTAKKVGVPDGKVITPTYGGGTGNDQTVPQGTATVEGQKELEYEKPSTDNGGVEALTDEKTDEKKDDKTDDREQKLSDEEMKDSKEVPQTPQEPEQTNDGKPKDADESFLDKYGDDTEQKDDKNDEKPEEKPEEKKDERYTPVAIKAETAECIAGDTIRFDITGDVESIAGYNGITVLSLKNGSITIDTKAGVSETITITVIGKDGSKAQATTIVKTMEEKLDKLVPEDTTDERKVRDWVPVSIRRDLVDVYVGDTIQLFIDGDIESVTGAGKTAADVKNGTLQIVAETVGKIVVTVNGKAGNTVSAVVEVKALPTKEETNPQVPSEDKAAEEEAARKAAEEAAAKKAAEEEAARKAAEEAAAKKAAEEEAARKAAEEAKKKEETKPAFTPVSISSQCGGTANAGDQVRFSISGDVASIAGTEGFATSNANGVLTVYTDPGVTTVITITVIGKDGSQASASVTVNCPLPDNA